MFNSLHFWKRHHVKDIPRSYKDDRYWLSYWSYVPPRLNDLRISEPEEDWWEWRGQRIHLDRYECTGAKVTVVLVHGAGGYGRMLSPYAYLLRTMGVRVVAPDLPNYGLTRAAKEMFDYKAWIDCINDLVSLEQATQGGKVILFGLSIGGYLALVAAAINGNAAGVMATTLADPTLPLVQDMFARNKVQSRFGVPLMPLLDPAVGKLTMPIKWFSKMDRIANDPKLVDVIKHDPCGGGIHVPVHFMRSIFDAGFSDKLIESLSCPVLFMQPQDDSWTPLEASEPVLKRLQTDKEIVLLDGCGHFPLEEPGFSQLEAAVSKFITRISEPE